jgi:serine/threonine protein kinase
VDEWSLPGYTTLQELGRGGFGRVVLARHEGSGTHVAVKYLTVPDGAFRTEFRAEAEVLRGLNDPHVVRLFDYVEAPQGAAIVMEAIDGVSLRALLGEHGRLDPEAALTVLKGSLLGLGAAHRVRVVHRDYKPGAAPAGELSDAVHRVMVVEREDETSILIELVRLADQATGAGRVRREDNGILVRGCIEIRQNPRARLLDELSRASRCRII